MGVAVPCGADEPRRMPARAGSELPALEEDDIGPPELREVIGDARAGHAAADDHRARALGQCPGSSGVPSGCVSPHYLSFRRQSRHSCGNGNDGLRFMCGRTFRLHPPEHVAAEVRVTFNEEFSSHRVCPGTHRPAPIHLREDGTR